MTQPFELLILAGDGIGPEVMEALEHIISHLSTHHNLNINITHDHIGGAAIDAYGIPFAPSTLAKAITADAVMLGAVGGPKWDGIDFEIRPEAGLLALRKELKLFANLRPAIVLDALIDASTLKPEIIKGLDIMIVRELTGGIYFGEPRGIEDLGDGIKRGINTQSYSTPEIERIGRIAFELAASRGGHVCSADKANVMESGMLWREVITDLQKSEYPDIQLSHIYADNCAMQLIRNPRQFDVIVTDNLFGDMLSDEAAMMTGSLGMLPSASMGDICEDGKRRALYEPVHGSAPDIAGKGIANPCATILSFAMCLKTSMDRPDLAESLEKAIQKTLSNGIRTADIMADGCKQVSTMEMAKAISSNI